MYNYPSVDNLKLKLGQQFALGHSATNLENWIWIHIDLIQSMLPLHSFNASFYDALKFAKKENIYPMTH